MAVFNIQDPLEGNIPRFTEEQLQEILDWFDDIAKPIIMDESEIKVITVENYVNFLSLKKFHRRSFKYPTYAEIMDDVEKFKAGLTKILTKEQFLYMLDKCVLQPDLKHELKLAFKVFDTENRDFLDLDDIQIIVTGYGETFDDAECREILRDANVSGDGNVHYENFVESLFRVAPELYELKAEYLYENPDEDPSIPPEPIVEPPPEQESPPPPPITPPPAPSSAPPPMPAKKGKKK